MRDESPANLKTPTPRGQARRAIARQSRDENQGANGGSAGRTPGDADGCAATGALAVSAARTCFGAVEAAAAAVELRCAAAGLAAEDDGVTAGCAPVEGVGMEALRPREFGAEGFIEAEGSFEADGSFAVEAEG
jgi:hypothetical protein